MTACRKQEHLKERERVSEGDIQITKPRAYLAFERERGRE